MKDRVIKLRAERVDSVDTYHFIAGRICGILQVIVGDRIHPMYGVRTIDEGPVSVTIGCFCTDAEWIAIKRLLFKSKYYHEILEIIEQ